MSKKYTQHIPIAWHHIRDARRLVEDALADHDRLLRDAAAMAMSELLENAMKHGESIPDIPGASFTLTVGEDELCIEVSNGVASEQSLAQLRSTLEAMAQAPDKGALYMERLQQILDNPNEGGRLGLYRIGFEGGFDVRYVYESPVVTITARRGLR